jgi:hypothetical protein
MEFDSKLRACPILLGASNYSTWKTKMEMVLIRERLWSIISGKRPKPDSGVKALADYEEDAERATATIFLYISETVDKYVEGLRDPIAIWARLRESFSRVGFAARYNLWKTLFTIKPGYGNDIVAYLDKVRGVGIQLKDSGVEVPDELLVTAALQGLGKDFDTVVSVITCGKEPSFDSLAALLSEEVERKGGEKVLNTGEAAFRAGEGRTVCWHCGKPGHKRERCFELYPELKGARGAGAGGSRASTGPLPTPSGGKGLSPGPEHVRGAVEASW